MNCLHEWAEKQNRRVIPAGSAGYDIVVEPNMLSPQKHIPP